MKCNSIVINNNVYNEHFEVKNHLFFHLIVEILDFCKKKLLKIFLLKNIVLFLSNINLN